MQLRSKLLLAGLAAVLLMALGTSSATARRLSVNETGFQMTWSFYEIVGDLGTVICPVTLSGNFHERTIPKALGLIGSLTRASAGDGSCSPGRATMLTGTLPWHVLFASYSGSLPRISGLNIFVVGMSLEVLIGGSACLFRTDFSEPLRIEIVVENGGNATSARLDFLLAIDVEDDRFMCALAGNVSMRGSGAIRGNVVFNLAIRLI